MSGNTVTLQSETLDLGVRIAARAFAKALTESAEFQAFEHAAVRLSQDETAQQAIQAFQKKQQSLQILLQLNAVSPADRAELERLQTEFINQPTVIEYMRAQEKLAILCQAAADLLSERIGLSYTAVCGPGCC